MKSKAMEVGWLKVGSGGGLLCALSLAACAVTPTADLLNGTSLSLDASTPKLISPVDQVKLTPNGDGHLATTLVWEARRGVASYEVDISLNPDFSTHIPGFPTTLRREATGIPATSLEFVASDALTYYWRVRSNLMPSGSYSETRKIHAFDAVYVFCPATVATCSSVGRIGNKSLPFMVIQDALSEAKSLGLEVRVATRGIGANTFYHESISLVTGVSLRGGYSHTDWSRNVSTNTTEIRHTASRVVSASYLPASGTFYLEGFRIASISAAETSYAVFVEGPIALVLSQNTIQGGSGTNVTGVHLSSTSPVIRENTITGANAGTNLSWAIAAVGGSPLIIGNTISGGTASTNCIAVALDGGAATLISNRISAGNCSSATSVQFLSNTTAFAVGNVFTATTSANMTTNLVISDASPRLAHNTSHSGHASTSRWLLLAGSSQPHIDANIFFASGVGTRQGVNEGSTPADPIHFRRNNLFDAGSGGSFSIYWNENTTNYPYMCSDGRPGITNGCITGVDVHAGGSTSGNVSVNDAGSQLFVDIAGADGMLNTHADNDLTLKATSPTSVRGGGLICSAEYSSLTHVWGNAANQAECDSKFPFARATFGGGSCRSTMLYPAIEIDLSAPGMGPANLPVAGNGLCESGETCSINPNMGAYGGHGAMVDAGCDVTGIISNINLQKFAQNGY